MGVVFGLEAGILFALAVGVVPSLLFFGVVVLKIGVV